MSLLFSVCLSLWFATTAGKDSEPIRDLASLSHLLGKLEEEVQEEQGTAAVQQDELTELQLDLHHIMGDMEVQYDVGHSGQYTQGGWFRRQEEFEFPAMNKIGRPSHRVRKDIHDYKYRTLESGAITRVGHWKVDGTNWEERIDGGRRRKGNTPSGSEMEVGGGLDGEGVGAGLRNSGYFRTYNGIEELRPTEGYFKTTELEALEKSEVNFNAIHNAQGIEKFWGQYGVKQNLPYTQGGGPWQGGLNLEEEKERREEEEEEEMGTDKGYWSQGGYDRNRKGFRLHLNAGDIIRSSSWDHYTNIRLIRKIGSDGSDWGHGLPIFRGVSAPPDFFQSPNGRARMDNHPWYGGTRAPFPLAPQVDIEVVWGYCQEVTFEGDT